MKQIKLGSELICYHEKQWCIKYQFLSTENILLQLIVKSSKRLTRKSGSFGAQRNAKLLIFGKYQAFTSVALSICLWKSFSNKTSESFTSMI